MQSLKDANLDASRGVALRELPMKGGFADYVLYVDHRAVGVVEAKPAGTTLRPLRNGRRYAGEFASNDGGCSEYGHEAVA